MPFGRTLILKISGWRPVESLVRKSFLFRPVVRRFIAGDTLEEAMTSAEALCARGFAVSLDYLGENTLKDAEAIAATDAYIAMIERIERSAAPKAINISIKLTQCGLDQGTDFAGRNYRRILEAAAPTELFVRVDMESSEYTQQTLDLVEMAFAYSKNTGTVLQSCLKRTLADAERMIELRARVRLVKGAYLEPDEVAYQSKKVVDERYLAIAKRLMSDGNFPALATHDEKIIRALKEYAIAEEIEKSRFEFQMLFGIRRDLQDSLLREGYRVRVYVPYGDQWYPYFMRRLAERPANALFILKSLFKR